MDSKRGREFIARPRFLAIREFAPNNIIYHEGAKWEVVGFQSPPGGLDERKVKSVFVITVIVIVQEILTFVLYVIPVLMLETALSLLLWICQISKLVEGKNYI